MRFFHFEFKPNDFTKSEKKNIPLALASNVKVFNQNYYAFEVHSKKSVAL